jgi:SAM-dependent methyltransferase
MYLRQAGRLVLATNIGGSSPHQHVIRMTVDGDFVTGFWRNTVKGAKHHGVLQLRVRASGKEMYGRWIGFDSDAGNTGGRVVVGETAVTGTFWNPSAADDPSDDIRELAAPQTISSVLDVGCGTGRNLVPFVDQPCSLHAIDADPQAVQATERRLADVPPGRLNASVADLRSFVPTRRFDLVICHGVLHFLTRRDREQAYRRIAAWVEPGGLISVVAFNSRIAIPNDLIPLMPEPADSDELRHAFPRWREIKFRSYDFQDEHCGGQIRHTHSIDRLIARAPGVDDA